MVRETDQINLCKCWIGDAYVTIMGPTQGRNLIHAKSMERISFGAKASASITKPTQGRNHILYMSGVWKEFYFTKATIELISQSIAIDF